LTLSEAKHLLASVQREIALRPSEGPRGHEARLPALRWYLPCEGLSGPCGRDAFRSGHDEAAPISLCRVWRDRSWHWLAVTLPVDTGVRPASGASLSPHDLRVAADLLGQMFPVDAGTDPETLRRHTMRAGEALADGAAIRPATVTPAIAVTLDSTFIRSCEDGERHLEVRVGNVETNSGGRQGFGAVAKADTDIKVLIRRNLDAVGRTEDTELTAFTDGCPGLRCILADADIAEPPILDWFQRHLALTGV
jgi:hypothetical protein